jgi:S1-C subfamily serine protease
MNIWKYGAAFVGGVIITAGVVGGVLALDGSDGGNNTPDSAAVVTDAPASGTGSQVLAVDEDCSSAADIYESVRPSVVQVNVSATQGTPFGNQQSSGTGTGIVLDDEGHILTNFHVAGDADTIDVRFSDGDVVSAEFVGGDAANDLAVIQVDPADHDLVPAELGDSDELRVGDPVLAIGSPFQLEGTLTQGVVSALDRTYAANNSTRPIRDMIQTDASINPGNSGGPLLNCYGEVVGINTLLENPTGDAVNVGIAFAVSINTAKSELDELTTGATVQHAWLGIAGADITPSLADALDLTVDTGVYVTLVTNGGPADDAGLVPAAQSENQLTGDVPPQGGDVITEADGIEMTGIDELATYLGTEKKPGDTVELSVVRDGEVMTVTATLDDWPE